MPFFEVDAQKCKRDKICIDECPIRILIADKETGVAKMRLGAEDACIRCGHCVAVCPSGAVRLEGMPFEEFVPLRSELTVAGEAAEQFLRGRRSIRTFRNQPVARELLVRVMDTVRWAPTASHRQPVRWVLVEDPARTRELAAMTIEWMTGLRESEPELARRYNVAGLIAGWRKGVDMVLRGAPHLAVACCNAADSWPAEDSAIALSYLELAAHAHGVGACWGGYFTRAANAHPPVRDLLGLHGDERVHGAQMLGYAKYRYRRIPQRKPLAITWK